MWLWVIFVARIIDDETTIIETMTRMNPSNLPPAIVHCPCQYIVHWLPAGLSSLSGVFRLFIYPCLLFFFLFIYPCDLLACGKVACSVVVCIIYRPFNKHLNFAKWLECHVKSSHPETRSWSSSLPSSCSPSFILAAIIH